MLALIDCNNFFVSCERVFQPRLENKPVVVLSNNDGCIISRSNEAKQLNIPMGAPFYQWKYFCAKHQVTVFSSNFELYGDMSQRVMSLLYDFSSQLEIYSIDEAFLHLDENTTFEDMLKLQQRIKQCTGMPVSIGVGATKTLAKLANYIAKNTQKPDIFFLLEDKMHYLSSIPVSKIWGIGRNLTEKLLQLNIDTADKLRQTDAKEIRMHFNVTVEKTVRELNGIPCLTDMDNPPKKQIISSRSFGKAVTELSELEEAVSCYVMLAAKKLRKQKSVSSAIYVFLQTNVFTENQARSNQGAMLPLPVPTADSRYLIKAAKQCLQKIYRKSHRYHKAGIMLLDISSATNTQYDLFTEAQNNKSVQMMQVMDNINLKLGKHAIFLGAEGTKKEWAIKCDQRSLRCTTRWDELMTVMCQ